METRENASYYAEKIVRESRHKFIYSYKNNRTLLIEELKKYPVTIGNDPSALYYKIEGLPKIDNNISDLNKNAISIICDGYFGFSIAHELIYSILNNNDLEKIKSLEYNLLIYVNRVMSKRNVDSISKLLQLLNETKEIYFEIYCNYLQQGTLLNPFFKAPLDFIGLSDFVNYVKKC